MSDMESERTLQAPRSQANGIAIAGFVFGVLGLLLSLVPYLTLLVGVPLDVLGIVCSAKGHARAQQPNVPYRGLSLAGLILAIIGLAFFLLWVLVYLLTR